MKSAFDAKNATHPFLERFMQAQAKEYIVSTVTVNGWLEVENIMKNGNDEQENERKRSHDTNEKNYLQASVSTEIKVFLPRHQNLRLTSVQVQYHLYVFRNVAWLTFRLYYPKLHFKLF
jgi:hypothetical protein